MPQFNADQDTLRRVEGLEAEHRPRDAFDGSIVLLDDSVRQACASSIHWCPIAQIVRAESSPSFMYNGLTAEGQANDVTEQARRCHAQNLSLIHI